MEGRLGRSINKHCRSCPAACCGPNINIEFSEKERDLLRSVGTYMVQSDDHPLIRYAQPGRTFYLLKSRCGFVVNEDGLQKCSIHDDPQRPAICGEFKAGGEICRKIKESRRVGAGYTFGY